MGRDGIFAVGIIIIKYSLSTVAKIVTARWDGFQTKIAAYDDPERRYIQPRSLHRPRLSPLATKNRDSAEGGDSSENRWLRRPGTELHLSSIAGSASSVGIADKS